MKWMGIALGMSALCTACMLGVLIRYSYYGLDLSDESLYLIWISSPFYYDWSISQFGYVYHPIYEVLNGNIAYLRQFNIVTTFALACALCCKVVGEYLSPASSGSAERIVIGCAFATVSFFLFASWVPTPGYNSLTLQAVLITVLGFAFAGRAGNSGGLVGGALIGIGGALTFLAKPSTAMLLAFWACIFLWLSGKANLRLLLAAVVSALSLLMAGALLIDGSVGQFVERVRTGIELVGSLEAGHTWKRIFRLDTFRLDVSEFAILAAVAAAAFFAAKYSRHMSGWGQGLRRLICFALGCVALMFLFEGAPGMLSLGRFQGLMIWSIPIAAVLLALHSRSDWPLQRSDWALFLTFLVMPHIFAFGTNVNYWQAGSVAAVFWSLSSVVVVGRTTPEGKQAGALAALALGGQVIVCILLQNGFNNPYRQVQPLRFNGQETTVGPSSSALIVSDKLASDLEAAVASARNAGFSPGTAIIDMTGGSPGVLYALQAEPLGQAWAIGNHKGSLKQATAALRRVSCEKIAGAWLLTEPKGPYPLPGKLLWNFGADTDRDYQPVAEWVMSVGSRARHAPSQVLLRPMRSEAEAISACEAKRSERPK